MPPRGRRTSWCFILLGAMGLFFVTGAPSVELSRFTPFFSDGKGGIGEVIALAAFVFVAFGGLLDVASVSEEVKNPKRNMPLGMLGGIITVTLLYGLVLFITVGVLPGRGAFRFADTAGGCRAEDHSRQLGILDHHGRRHDGVCHDCERGDHGRRAFSICAQQGQTHSRDFQQRSTDANSCLCRRFF